LGDEHQVRLHFLLKFDNQERTSEASQGIAMARTKRKSPATKAKASPKKRGRAAKTTPSPPVDPAELDVIIEGTWQCLARVQLM